MRSRFREIIQAARDCGLDPAEAVMEYLEEKDSRPIRRKEAERIVRLNEESWSESNTSKTGANTRRSRTETGT